MSGSRTPDNLNNIFESHLVTELDLNFSMNHLFQHNQRKRGDEFRSPIFSNEKPVSYLFFYFISNKNSTVGIEYRFFKQSLI